jgi:hypothetical protein
MDGFDQDFINWVLEYYPTVYADYRDGKGEELRRMSHAYGKGWGDAALEYNDRG